MSYKMTESGTTNVFFCDEANDLEKIPKNEINFGSAAIIIDTALIYIANSKKQWVPFGVSLSEEGGE